MKAHLLRNPESEETTIIIPEITLLITTIDTETTAISVPKTRSRELEEICVEAENIIPFILTSQDVMVIKEATRQLSNLNTLLARKALTAIRHQKSAQ